MGKEGLLNILDRDARTVFETAERLALRYGGTVSPFHIVYAGLQTFSPCLPDGTEGELKAVNLELAKFLSMKFPGPSESILVSLETQSVLKELSGPHLANRTRANVSDLIAAAAESDSVKEWLCCEPAIGCLIARVVEELRQTGQQKLQTTNDSSQPLSHPEGRAEGTNRDSGGVVANHSGGARPMATAPSATRLTGAFGGFCEEVAARSNPHPFIGREREVTAVLETLCRKLKNNPLLVGKPGVGKTALVGAVAARLREGQVPGRLKGKRILEVSRIKLLADARYTGEIEERLKLLVEETQTAGDVILFFDEIHTL
ncbi:MAG: AAA family ATPase, partial [Blastocatellia bacterium]